MNAVERHRKNKSFALSVPKWHWSSLIVTIGNMGYLPKYEWSHWGSLSMSILPPLALVLLGGHVSVLPTVIAIILSCALANHALHHIAARGVESDHDASAIVIDEVAGSSVAMLAVPIMLPLLGWEPTLHNGLVCALFVGWVFRFFDIYKPFPANVFDTVWHHPFAVMADDLVAGFYAALVGVAFAIAV
ncbi:MAG: phosphatidylglycerophosphatase A [Pseudomonadaceae bacterium]|nr:phosphatidylglycerophosphatase A [Pseudomonadaceae bacterium]